MNFFETLLSMALPHPSAWRLVASGSANVDVGTPIARVYVSGTGGVLYMGTGNKNMCFPYPYGGAGGGVGLALEIPVSAGVSTPSLPSTGGEWGRLYTLPALIDSSDVTKDTITGPAVLVSPNAAWFGGAGYASFILFGAQITGMMGPLTLLTTAKAVAFQAGLSIITPGLGVSVTAYQLYIGKAGQLTRM